MTRPLCFLEYRTKQEDNESEEEVIRYCHGPGIDEPISIEKDNKTYYYHYDGLGSVIALTDKNQKITDSYSYDSFGNLNRQGNKVKNSFTYTGREFDKETGLYYYRNRYYDPGIGRFITTDPIGYAGGINLYAYVGNNPVNFTDPWGWNKEKKWKFGKWLFPIEIQVGFNPMGQYAAAYGPFVIQYGPLYRAQDPLVRKSIRFHEQLHTKQWGWGLRDIVDIIQNRPKSREIEAYTKQKEFIQEKIESPAVNPESKKALENMLEDVKWYLANPKEM